MKKYKVVVARKELFEEKGYFEMVYKTVSNNLSWKDAKNLSKLHKSCSIYPDNSKEESTK
jgi:hypothetical protein